MVNIRLVLTVAQFITTSAYKRPYLVFSNRSKVELNYFASHGTSKKQCSRIDEGQGSIRDFSAFWPDFSALPASILCVEVQKRYFHCFSRIESASKNVVNIVTWISAGKEQLITTYTPKVYSYGNWLACHCSYNDRSFEPGRSYMRLFFEFCAAHNHLGVHKDESSLFHLLQSRLSRLCIAWYNGKPCSRLEQRAGKASTSAPFGLTSAPSQLQLFASKCKNNILIVCPEFETANGNVRPS